MPIPARPKKTGARSVPIKAQTVMLTHTATYLSWGFMEPTASRRCERTARPPSLSNVDQASQLPPTLDAQNPNRLTVVAMASNQPNLLEVDWSKTPAPQDDAAAPHLMVVVVPDVSLTDTNGTQVSLAKIPGRVVLFAYPRTGVPGQISL